MKNDIYRELKKIDPHVYRECVERAEVIAINNNLSLDAGADIEASMVELALNIKKGKRSGSVCKHSNMSKNHFFSLSYGHCLDCGEEALAQP